MKKITESDIETLTIELLESSGYQYIYGPDIAPYGNTLLPKLINGEVRVKIYGDDGKI